MNISVFRSKSTVHSGARLIALLAALFVCDPAALATTRSDLVPDQTSIDQKLNQPVDMNLVFTDENGKTGKLSELVAATNRPTVIAPVYYRCPSLCTLTLNGLLDSVNKIDLKLGDDYNVLAVSFNPAETPEVAKKKSATYLDYIKDKPAAIKGWRYLTGSDDNIKPLMNQIGFNYSKDGDEYVHSSAIMLLTPQGKLSKYFSGVEYSADDLRLALVDASEGKIGTIVDQIFLFCFHFDILKGKYSLRVMRMTQVVSGILVLVLGGWLIRLHKQDRLAWSSKP